MMKRYFDYMFQVYEFIDKLVDNGHYGEFRIIKEGSKWAIYW